MEGVVKFSSRPASHCARGRGSGRKAYSTTTSKQDSPHDHARGRGRRHTKQASPRSAS